jgi:hypothetical protein
MGMVEIVGGPTPTSRRRIAALEALRRLEGPAALATELLLHSFETSFYHFFRF